MSIRIGGSPSSTPIHGPELPDQDILGQGTPSTSKKLKKGVSDLPDSYEPTPQNPQLQGLQHPGLQHPGVHAPQAQNKDSITTNIPSVYERRRDRIDEHGYRWLSFLLEPPTVKNSELVNTDNPATANALEKLGDLWKDYADRAASQPIRA